MSAIPIVTPADLRTRSPAARARPRVWLRTLSFAALALYGVQRWGQLMRDPPAWRLLGLAALAIALATVVPLVRHLAADWPAHAGRVLTGLLAAALGLAALPVAGLRWHWVIDLRIAVCARAIGHGLTSLGEVLVPYQDHGYAIRLVMTLGAAVLLIDAAAALAYAPREIGDGRRAAAALPLIALAVVPATLVPPRAPALQGLILFLLLAAFLWGERIARPGLAAAVAVACVAGVTGAIAAAILAPTRAWVDYRAWAGSPAAGATESFDWNQTYGPLRWPQDGRLMFTVHAAHGDYWKAEDLTRFTGTAWVAAPSAAGADPGLPAPAARVRRRFSEPVTVTLDALHTSDVIGGGGETVRPRLQDGVRAGAVPGTWVADVGLGPGDTYTVDSYSPTPSAGELQRPGVYPWAQLAPDLALTLPEGSGSHPRTASLAFAGFHQPVPAATRAALAASPYAPAFALARRLAAGAATPDAFVAAVTAYLDGGRYGYDQATAASRYPLLTFLFTTRQGYCQQFSGAMAMLLRMGGVPARVAAGFTTGVAQPHGAGFAVSDLDAHAWVEAWFPRYGWVRFDPTPSGAPARGGTPAAGTPGIAPAQAARAAGTPRGDALAAHPHGAGAAATHRVGPVRRSASPGSGTGAGAWPWVGGGLAIALALALAAGLGLRRAGAGADPLAELERALQRTGRPLGDGATLAGLERRLGDAPEAAGYVRALRLQRYGPGAEVPSPAGRRALRAALASGSGVAGRLRALWALPPRPGRPPVS